MILTKNKRALFVKTKHLGDSIILTSAIEALPNDWTVDVFCYPESEPIFRMNHRVLNVYIAPRHLTGFAKLKHYVNTYQAMKANKYDLLAQFSDDWRGAFFARLLNVKLSVAKQNFKRPRFWFNSFDQIARLVRNGRHASEQDVDLLRKVGLYEGKSSPAYKLSPSASDLKFAKDWLLSRKIDFSKKIVVIHSSSRWKFKTMNITIWSDLINKLYEHGECEVLLTGSSADVSFNKKIIDQSNHTPALACDFSLSQTAALYQYADLLISIDSMSIHLGSAMSKPIIAIFGPTDIKVWGPHAVTYKALVSGHSCVPCGIDGCGGGKVSHCLESITPNQIYASAIQILSGLDS